MTNYLSTDFLKKELKQINICIFEQEKMIKNEGSEYKVKSIKRYMKASKTRRNIIISNLGGCA